MTNVRIPQQIVQLQAELAMMHNEMMSLKHKQRSKQEGYNNFIHEIQGHLKDVQIDQHIEDEVAAAFERHSPTGKPEEFDEEGNGIRRREYKAGRRKHNGHSATRNSSYPENHSDSENLEYLKEVARGAAHGQGQDALSSSPNNYSSLMRHTPGSALLTGLKSTGGMAWDINIKAPRSKRSAASTLSLLGQDYYN